MITGNINVSMGVANGTRCTLNRLSYGSYSTAPTMIAERIQQVQPGEIIKVPAPEYIVVRVDNINEDIIIARNSAIEKTATDRKMKTFQVELAFAVTYHKVQGQTLSKVVLELNRHPAGLGSISFESLYVGMTRTRNAADTFIMPPRGEGLSYLADKRPSTELMTWLQRRRKLTTFLLNNPAAQLGEILEYERSQPPEQQQQSRRGGRNRG